MPHFYDDYGIDSDVEPVSLTDELDEALVTAGVYLDGTVPTTPEITCYGMLGGIIVKWVPLTNSSPVTYDVHISATTGFTPSASTIVGTNVQGGMHVIRKLTDGTAMSYLTDYFVVLIARDGDGDGTASTQVTARMDQTATGDLVANSVTAEKLAAILTISSIFRTAESGQRVEFDTDGIRLIASDGTIIINLPTDSTTNASFNGDIEIGTEVVHTQQTMEGVLSFDTGSYASLASYQTDPGVAPTLTQSLGSLTFNSSSTEAASARRSLWWDGTYFCYLTGGIGDAQVLVRVNTSGTEVDRTTLAFSSADDFVHSIVKIGSYWYGLGYDSLFSWYHQIWGVDGSGLPTGNATKRSFGGDWTGIYSPMNATDGTDLYVAQSDKTPIGGTNAYQILKYTVSAATAPSLVFNRLTSTNPGAASVAAYYRGSGDLGATRHIVIAGGASTFRSYDNTNPPTAQTAENWTASPTPGANDNPGICYDGTNFWQMSLSSKELIKYSGWLTGNGTTTTPYYVAYTWADSDATGGTHESGLSPRSSVNFKNRRYLTVTWSTIPDNGGTDDPNAVNVYAKQTSTATSADTFAELFEQSMGATGTSVDLATYLSATAGGQDTSFASVSGAAAYIASAVPTTHASLQGDGDGFLPIGCVQMWAGGSTPPTGWLLCDGTAVSRTTYADLYAIVSTTWGVGDGTTTFNLPDFDARFPLGVSGSAPARAGTGGTADHAVQGQTATQNNTNAADQYDAVVVTGGAASVSRPNHEHDPGTMTTDNHTVALDNIGPYLGIYFIIKY